MIVWSVELVDQLAVSLLGIFALGLQLDRSGVLLLGVEISHIDLLVIFPFFVYLSFEHDEFVNNKGHNQYQR